MCSSGRLCSQLVTSDKSLRPADEDEDAIVVVPCWEASSGRGFGNTVAVVGMSCVALEGPPVDPVSLLGAVGRMVAVSTERNKVFGVGITD